MAGKTDDYKPIFAIFLGCCLLCQGCRSFFGFNQSTENTSDEIITYTIESHQTSYRPHSWKTNFAPESGLYSVGQDDQRIELESPENWKKVNRGYTTWEATQSFPEIQKETWDSSG